MGKGLHPVKKKATSKVEGSKKSAQIYAGKKG